MEVEELEQAAARVLPAPVVQLYLLRDRGVTEDLVHRAVAAGYRAIMLTVDAPVIGHRPRATASREGWRNANFDRYPDIDADGHGYVSTIRADIGWAGRCRRWTCWSPLWRKWTAAR